MKTSAVAPKCSAKAMMQSTHHFGVHSHTLSRTRRMGRMEEFNTRAPCVVAKLYRTRAPSADRLGRMRQIHHNSSTSCLMPIPGPDRPRPVAVAAVALTGLRAAIAVAGAAVATSLPSCSLVRRRQPLRKKKLLRDRGRLEPTSPPPPPPPPPPPNPNTHTLVLAATLAAPSEARRGRGSRWPLISGLPGQLGLGPRTGFRTRNQNPKTKPGLFAYPLSRSTAAPRLWSHCPSPRVRSTRIKNKPRVCLPAFGAARGGRSSSCETTLQYKIGCLGRHLDVEMLHPLSFSTFYLIATFEEGTAACTAWGAGVAPTYAFSLVDSRSFWPVIVLHLFAEQNDFVLFKRILRNGI
jgi:hypothetical protein